MARKILILLGYVPPWHPGAFWEGFLEKGHPGGIKYQLKDSEGVRSTERHSGS